MKLLYTLIILSAFSFAESEIPSNEKILTALYGNYNKKFDVSQITYSNEDYCKLNESQNDEFDNIDILLNEMGIYQIMIEYNNIPFSDAFKDAKNKFGISIFLWNNMKFHTLTEYELNNFCTTFLNEDYPLNLNNYDEGYCDNINQTYNGTPIEELELYNYKHWIQKKNFCIQNLFFTFFPKVESILPFIKKNEYIVILSLDNSHLAQSMSQESTSIFAVKFKFFDNQIEVVNGKNSFRKLFDLAHQFSIDSIDVFEFGELPNNEVNVGLMVILEYHSSTNKGYKEFMLLADNGKTFDLVMQNPLNKMGNLDYCDYKIIDDEYLMKYKSQFIPFDEYINLLDEQTLKHYIDKEFISSDRKPKNIFKDFSQCEDKIEYKMELTGDSKSLRDIIIYKGNDLVLYKYDGKKYVK